VYPHRKLSTGHKSGECARQGWFAQREVSLSPVRAGVGKCGARLEILLRGPTQWCVEIWGGASRHNNRNRWCWKGEARKDVAKTSQAETSMDSAVKPKKIKELQLSSVPRFYSGTSLTRYYKCCCCREVRYWVLC